MSLQTEITQFTGTDNWYRHWTKAITYTDGVKFVAEKYGAYWLIDAIASYQHKKILHENGLEDFQLWELTVNQEKSTAILKCRRDTDEAPLITQRIPFTDFPESIKLYVEGGVLLLPNEH